MTNNKKSSNQKAVKKELPMVSVCTPTFNRRPFIENMFNCFRNQTYPKHRIEWIIVDDGTDKIRDLVETSNIPQIRYFEVAEKMTLGAKRNYMHSFVRGQIIVYMDDDDYYPPERIEDAVEKLENNPNALCAGSSEIYIYFKHIQKMYQCGPYGPNHATAGTFAFRKELLQQTRYEDTASLAEERAFLKEYTIPFVQLDPMKAILVFSHEHNTFDKRKMLDNQHPNYFKESPKTVEMFIRKEFEKPVKDFFMRDIDKLLENYEPGLPKMKPDVLKQIKEIEAEREKMVQEEMKKMQNNSPIMLQRPGQEPVQLSNQDVVNMIQDQQKQIAQLAQKCGEFENMVTILQKQLVDKTKTNRDLTNGTPVHKPNNITTTIVDSDDSKKTSELENMITMLQKQLIEKTKTIRELSSAKAQGSVQAQPPNNSDDLIKQNNELQKMVGMLQQQLIEKTIALREANSNKEKMTKIPIQVEESVPTRRSKSDPEVIVDVNAI
jgi:glycosyltransferase involved in cell wall biosynthesis